MSVAPYCMDCQDFVALDGNLNCGRCHRGHVLPATDSSREIKDLSRFNYSSREGLPLEIAPFFTANPQDEPRGADPVQGILHVMQADAASIGSATMGELRQRARIAVFEAKLRRARRERFWFRVRMFALMVIPMAAGIALCVWAVIEARR